MLTGIQLYSLLVSMKATIDIPDQLYRQVKAKSAMEGRAVREVAIRLFQGWVEQEDNPVQTPPVLHEHSAPTWFGGARKYAKRVDQHDMASIRRSIDRGRPDGEKAP